MGLILQDIVIGAAALLFLAVAIPYSLEYFVYRRQAKAKGCGDILTLMQPPLGIPAVIDIVRSFSKNQILDYFQDLFQYLNDLGGHNTGRTCVAGMMWIGTVDPENVKSILATSFKDYSLGFRYDAMYPLLGKGIFTLSGDGWKHSRAMLRPQFARDQVSRMESLRHHIGMLMDRFKETSVSGKSVDAQVLYHCLTLDSATEFLFGESASTLDSVKSLQGIPGPRGTVTGAEFADSFTYCLELIAYRIIAGPAYFLVNTPRFRRSVKVCHNFVDYFVNKALEKPMEKDEEAESYVFIRELTKESRDPTVIRDQAFNILLAGRDTTAALLSFTTVYLGTYKNVWKEMREAVLAEFGSDESEITFESLKRCKYMQNVLNEVLRLHPIVPLNFRMSIRDTKLPRGGGPNGDLPVFVPKGTNVFYDTHAMQRSQEFWGKDAEEFKPDRWNDSKSVGWEFIPFNGGPRICLGQQFALIEASYTLVRICQLFRDIELEHPTPRLDTTKLDMYMRLTASVAGGVVAKFHV